MKKRLSLLMCVVLLVTAFISGCSGNNSKETAVSSGNSISEVNKQEDAGSEISVNASTSGKSESASVNDASSITDNASSSLSQSTEEEETFTEVEFHGLTFNVSSRYNAYKNDESGSIITIVYETDKAYLQIAYLDTDASALDASERQMKTKVSHIAFMSAFPEKQNESQGNVNVDGVTAEVTVCLARKSESDPWLSIYGMTVPTKIADVCFLYWEKAGSDTSHAEEFEVLVNSIKVIK